MSGRVIWNLTQVQNKSEKTEAVEMWFAVLNGANITVRVTNNDCLETAGDRRI